MQRAEGGIDGVSGCVSCGCCVAGLARAYREPESAPRPIIGPAARPVVKRKATAVSPRGKSDANDKVR
jgi:hypothetical protein